VDEHDEQLEKYLREVPGGEEVVEARRRELSRTALDRDPYGEEEALLLLRGGAVARRGAGELPEGFWALPWPEDPEASVRKALEEDRR